ncbi:CPBP family glutamic-type intramembrane protease [Streptococcus downei]|uniref:CAAX amino protease n=1 Tax=Streptococcus downei MFe28 TaxID=764290 RepID=A0A380JFA5_STRDO|nr:CPBP family intramembrane glutamic endopeptidase [Streptococcus downei]EFQ57529.1 CAAX amino terminal protease family protein [Streptococcus downei F0415]SUN36615.1 CAAX amino protease [Streptococcus downei MFe28]
MLVINQLLSAFLQLGLVILLSLVWYFIRQHKIQGYFSWLGLKSSKSLPWKPMLGIFLAYFILAGLPYLWFYQTGSLQLSDFRAQVFHQLGWSWQTVLVILVWSVFQTSLSEEIFFRGFLGKRLMARLGFVKGNSLQALLFGSLHTLALAKYNLLAAFLVFLLTAGVAYALGWLMAKKADGSIIYGWLIHALTNFFSSFLLLSLPF